MFIQGSTCYRGALLPHHHYRGLRGWKSGIFFRLDCKMYEGYGIFLKQTSPEVKLIRAKTEAADQSSPGVAKDKHYP